MLLKLVTDVFRVLTVNYDLYEITKNAFTLKSAFP